MIVTRPLSSAGFGTAACDTSDAVGDLVYIAGPKTGPDYTVAKVDPSDFSKFPAVAVIIAKITSTRAVIQFGGEVRGIYTGLTPGRVYWAGSTGTPVLSPPSPVLSGKMRWQSVGVAVDSDTLRLEPLKNAVTRVG